MTELCDEIMTTLISEGTAIILLIGLVLLSRHLVKKSSLVDTLFASVCVLDILVALFGSFAYLMRYQTFSGVRPLTIVFVTLMELFALLLMFQWLILVDFTLFRSRDHINRNLLLIAAPLLVGVVFLVTNLFTGIVFTLNDDNFVEPHFGYNIVFGLQIWYLLVSLVLVFRVKTAQRGPRFLGMAPFIIPSFLGVIVTTYTPYSARGLGIAVGLTLIHFSRMNKRIYVDRDTEFFNRAYLKFLLDFAGKAKIQGGSVISFQMEGDAETFAEVLKGEIPDNATVISLGDGTFLLLTAIQRKSSLRMLVENIRDAASEKGLSFREKIAVKKESQTSREFMEQFVAL